jgi:hypothetical protein
MFRKYLVETTTSFLKDRFAEKRGFRLAYAAFAAPRLRRVRVANHQ